MRKRISYVLLLFLISIITCILLFRNQTTDDYDGDDGDDHDDVKVIIQEISNNLFKCPIEKKPKDKSEPLVALATFPGSGTTWIRYLIEESTGCITGTIYNRDDEHFIGGNINNGRALVIKTHYIYKEIFLQKDPGMLNDLKHHPSMVEFGRAIILLRNPRESIIAETNRYFTDDPTGFLNKSWDDPDVITFQTQLAKRWPRFVEGWLRNFVRPKLVILYEDLTSHRTKQIHTIGNFLNKTVIENGMECIREFPDGYAKRNKTMNRPMFLNPIVEKLIENGLRTTFNTRRMFGVDYTV